MLSQRLQPINPGCNITVPPNNLMEFIPYRWQSFWTGTTKVSIFIFFALTCECKSHSQFSALVDQKLTITCDKKAYYSLLPQTEKFTATENDYANFQVSIMSKIERKVYEEPVIITQHYSVLTECGEETNLLSQVYPVHLTKI